MLGNLILNRDPISSLQAATKRYVDKLKAEIIAYVGDDNSLWAPGVDYTLTKTFTRIEPKILFFFKSTLEDDVASYYPAFYIKNDSNSYKVYDNATLTSIYVVFNGKEITFHETFEGNFYTEINRVNCNYTILGIE